MARASNGDLDFFSDDIDFNTETNRVLNVFRKILKPPTFRMLPVNLIRMRLFFRPLIYDFIFEYKSINNNNTDH